MFRFAHPDFLYLPLSLPALVLFYIFTIICTNLSLRSYVTPSLFH